jgi:hypothetical protein
VITEKEFKKIADTGDILLFRGKALGSKITRTFTSSHFGTLVAYSSNNPSFRSCWNDTQV